MVREGTAEGRGGRVSRGGMVIDARVGRALIGLQGLRRVCIVVSKIAGVPFILYSRRAFSSRILICCRRRSTGRGTGALTRSHCRMKVTGVRGGTELKFFAGLCAVNIGTLTIGINARRRVEVRLRRLMIHGGGRRLPRKGGLVRGPRLRLATVCLVRRVRHDVKPRVPRGIGRLRRRVVTRCGGKAFVMKIRRSGRIPLLERPSKDLCRPVFASVVRFAEFTRNGGVGATTVPTSGVPRVLVPSTGKITVGPFNIGMHLSVAGTGGRGPRTWGRRGVVWVGEGALVCWGGRWMACSAGGRSGCY